MVFRRIIFNAVFIGLAAGLLLSLIQVIGVSPIIFEAETFEVVEEAPAAAAHDHHGVEESSGHHHDAEAWAPEDGAERTLYTVASNVLAGIGFASVVLALMSQLQLQGITQVNVQKGLLWGLAGFAVFFVAPGIGLPPEIPGTEAAVIENRQLWWLFAVVCAAIGLAVMAFAPIKLKILGALSIALPYIVGAPHVDGPEFAHPDPAAVASLTELHFQFIMASGIANLIFWIVLGIACAWALNLWVHKDIDAHVSSAA
ncbi:CbtA family protein [Alkalimarinus alittae]|uniref:CbtA family protein n=1 Tax=Alkalimarinus alittae TaxID=2961619 RepID=A0ABY6N5T6_9ALTE|nr:CbtA family protein [Alkalimarinus alittae]UZE97478.1 CbtA family protein [Alkalimarinus alittae]